ncbi:MAG TPA: ABC transporter permease [Gemmatimonadales bacterium]|jgi:lipopolysaccharide transport system permease protein|nr:ABC transporter permease [Gemmatimonadales bacterium]
MPPTGPAPVTTIRPPRGWAPLDVREYLGAHELLYFLVLRNLKLRYKQTLLGAAWAVLQPLLTMAVFTVVFGRLARLSSDGLPYEVFALAALVPWTYFANALAQAGNSLVDQHQLLTKVYFPRLLLPLAAVLAGLVDLTISFVMLLVVLAWFGIEPSVRLLAAPAFALLATAAAFAPGLWLAAFNVRYRDVRYVIPFLVQIWLFATPVAYSGSLVPERWRPLYGLNPMVGVVDGFRWMIAPAAPFPATELAAGALAVALVLLTGLFVFRRMEQSFADVV